MLKSSSLSMYVIATVFCSNFHFSVSLHVPFFNLLFERDSYSNEYLLFTFKIWRRYSRERTSQSLRKINQTLEKQLDKIGWSAEEEHPATLGWGRGESACQKHGVGLRSEVFRRRQRRARYRRGQRTT